MVSNSGIEKICSKKPMINLCKIPGLTNYYAISRAYKIVAEEFTPDLARNTALARGFDTVWIVPVISVTIKDKSRIIYKNG